MTEAGHAADVASFTAGAVGVPLHAMNVVPRITGYVYDPRMTMHATLAEDEHPERPERITSIFTLLQAHGCIQRMHRIMSREATLAEVALVHAEELWHTFERTVLLPVPELRELSKNLELSSSLYLNPYSTFCARLSCGSVIEICAAVASARIQNGFAIVRPPGHHAEPDSGQGFCLYNNVAVAARSLLMNGTVQRVMILDWDVHHGNGTQRIFWDDPNVLYVSLHRYENGTFYPGTTFGNYDQVGGPGALGTSVNVPWPCTGMGDADYLAAFHQCILPIAHEFAPDLVIVSAGFDAAQDDLLGGNRVSPAGYAHMTHELMALAHGKVAVALEGGYTLDAISRSALAVVRTLLGDAVPPLARGAVCSTAAAHTIRRVMRAHAPHWHSMRAALELERCADAPDALPLPTLVLEARAARLWKTHQLLPMPVRDGMHANQALCSSSLMLPTADTLIVFVHDMGALHQDGSGAPYMSDAADAVVHWAAAHNCAILDISTMCTLQREPVCSHTHVKALPAPGDPSAAGLFPHIEYIWDHFCAISSTKRIVLVGLGTGCDVLMHLVSMRDVTHRVCEIIQVVGAQPIPLVPKSRRELKAWYLAHSKVLCPPTHPYFVWGEQVASGKRLGNVIKAESTCPMHTLRDAVSALDPVAPS